jgi:uncharacterized protein (TIGR02246 family)
MSADVQDNCKVIDQLVEAYNRRDAQGFASLFAEDGWHGNRLTDAPLVGRRAIAQRYTEVFAMYPENQTEVVHRIAFGPFVIDHEKVRRSSAADPFDVVAIYTLKNSLIERLEMVRE